MAPKQSCFVEGSMNDRVSAAPPPDFLDEGTSTADYEKQFAMDWRPPELKFATGSDAGGGGGGGGADNGHSNVPGSRNSFVSVHSGLSAFTTRTGAGAAASTASTKTPRSLFGKVREKLAMPKSRSSWAVGGAADDADDNNNDTDKNSSWANFPIPPVFKHKRSESMDPSTLRENNRSSGVSNSNTQPTTEFGKFQQDAAARAGGGRPAPPVRADSLMASLPSFDPTKRPTRDEITANYQSLLASGFFGTHAIQSTRFSPPGANTKRRSEASPEVASLAQKMEEETEEGPSQFPPSPERQPPPPPPPRREPPPPPAPEMAMDVEDEESASSTPTAIPASSTAVFSPLPLSRPSSRDRDTTMSPPPLPKQRTQKQPALAFASVPYSATRPGAEPTLTARPYRPPPVSLARFSVDSSRPRSIDVQSFARGTKRPFSSSGTNGSQTSFYTHRSSYDYDPMATDGHGGIGVATTTAEEKVESGPRKLVKRLRKSASKLSFRSNNSSMKFSGGQGNNEGEDGGELQQPPTRTSMSSTVRRSFSWRLGASKPEISSATSSSNNIFGGFKSAGGSDNSSLNNSTNTSMDSFQPPPPPAPTFPPPSPPRGLPTIAASPSSADRNRLKKREIRARRLRRKEESHTPTKNSSQQPTQDAMDWQHPPSPSKRPRRSDASIFLRALNSNPVMAVEEDSGSEPEMPMPVAAQEEPLPQQPQSLPPAEGMEGVEFSFHFPGRTRPTSTPANGLHLGGPLAVVPDVNRGMMPSMSSAFQGFGAKKSGSVRVVRGDFM
ncbi:hypothetical protein N0V82_006244 [Gnomoniopsis sp. IMI 355080]|nr:hypothetical protein N0V82_006244 [Gnomoniopsis sp. IMI 355080]